MVKVYKPGTQFDLVGSGTRKNSPPDSSAAHARRVVSRSGPPIQKGRDPKIRVRPSTLSLGTNWHITKSPNDFHEAQFPQPSSVPDQSPPPGRPKKVVEYTAPIIWLVNGRIPGSRFTMRGVPARSRENEHAWFAAALSSRSVSSRCSERVGKFKARRPGGRLPSSSRISARTTRRAAFVCPRGGPETIFADRRRLFFESRRLERNRARPPSVLLLPSPGSAAKPFGLVSRPACIMIFRGFRSAPNGDRLRAGFESVAYRRRAAGSRRDPDRARFLADVRLRPSRRAPTLSILAGDRASKASMRCKLPPTAGAPSTPRWIASLLTRPDSVGDGEEPAPSHPPRVTPSAFFFFFFTIFFLFLGERRSLAHRRRSSRKQATSALRSIRASCSRAISACSAVSGIEYASCVTVDGAGRAPIVRGIRGCRRFFPVTARAFRQSTPERRAATWTCEQVSRRRKRAPSLERFPRRHEHDEVTAPNRLPPAPERAVLREPLNTQSSNFPATGRARSTRRFFNGLRGPAFPPSHPRRAGKRARVVDPEGGIFERTTRSTFGPSTPGGEARSSSETTNSVRVSVVTAPGALRHHHVGCHERLP